MNNHNIGLLLITRFINKYDEVKSLINGNPNNINNVKLWEIIMFTLMTLSDIRDEDFLTYERFEKVDNYVRIKLGTGNSKKCRQNICSLLLFILIKSNSDYTKLTNDESIQELLVETSNILERKTIDDSLTSELPLNNFQAGSISNRIDNLINGTTIFPTSTEDLREIIKTNVIRQPIIEPHPHDIYNVDNSIRVNNANDILNQINRRNINLNYAETELIL